MKKIGWFLLGAVGVLLLSVGIILLQRGLQTDLEGEWVLSKGNTACFDSFKLKGGVSKEKGAVSLREVSGNTTSYSYAQYSIKNNEIIVSLTEPATESFAVVFDRQGDELTLNYERGGEQRSGCLYQLNKSSGK